MAAGSDYAFGSASLATLLAAHTSIVSVTQLLGGKAAYTGSYNTGWNTGSLANSDAAKVVTNIVPDNRVWYVVWNA